MQIRYTLTPDDLWRYNKFVVRRTPSFLLIYLTRLLSVPVGILVLFWSMHFSVWLCLAATAAIACAWIPFCLWSGRYSYVRANQQRPGVLGAYVLTLTAEGVKQETPNAESLMKWSGFTEIVETPHLITFFVNRKYAVVVPKHAFSSPDAGESFLAAAKTYHQGLPVPIQEASNVWPPPPQTGVYPNQSPQ